MKRVIGIPGDLIEIRHDEILINNEKEKGNYIYKEEKVLYKPTGFLRLKDHEYFVLGDNRNRSFDSTEFGPVESSYFIGRVKSIYWPLGRRKEFERNQGD